MEQKSQSEFNMAFDYLHRINVLFYCSNSAATSLDGFQWHQILLAIFRELSTEMSEQELNKMNIVAERIQQKVMAHQMLMEKRGSASMPPQLYWELHQFELMLRKVMDKSGMLTKRIDDPTRALR